MLTKLFFGLAALPATVHGCTVGSSLEGGVCKELRQEGPSSLELLQHSMDKVHAAEHSDHKRLTIEQHKGETQSKLQRQLPDIQDWSASEVVYKGLADILNASLRSINRRADIFLARCNKFHTSTEDVNMIADEGIDAGARKIQDLIIADIPSIKTQIDIIVQQFLDTAQSMISGMEKLGLDGTVELVQKTRNTLSEVAQKIYNVFKNAKVAIKDLDIDSASKDQKDETLAQLDALAAEGLKHTASFKKDLVGIVRAVIDGIANRIDKQLLVANAGVPPDVVKAAFIAGADVNRQNAEVMATKLSSGLEAVFEGMHAAIYAVQT